MQTVDSNPGSSVSPTWRQLGEHSDQPTAALGRASPPTLNLEQHFMWVYEVLGLGWAS